MSKSKKIKEVATSGKEDVPSFSQHATLQERYAAGKTLRSFCPRDTHDSWKVTKNRKEVISLIEASEKGRVESLIPLRHGRMSQSPFTFYRAGALLMAHDLAKTPNSGYKPQICGDCHLSNFGGFATPERQIIFSINDMDETLPAPWEWDIKRLATSFVIACRNNGLSDKIAEDTARQCIQSYREHLAKFSMMPQMELWYYMIDSATLIAGLDDPDIRKRAIKRIEKARESKIADDVFPKLAAKEGEIIYIKDQLPTIFHWEGHEPGEINKLVKFAFSGYRDSLSSSYQTLLDRYEMKDVAIKVVGVGSVGTLCWVLLMMASEHDPLFLQAKQAGPSVLEAYAGKSRFENHGQRVVNGYRLLQPASDIFLGWTRGRQGRDFYFRQLRDMKIKILVEIFGKSEMNIFADWCGQALALAHARGGDAALLSGYLGKGDAFDKAGAKFALAYADQNERDYEVFMRAIKQGKLKAEYEAPEA